MTFLCTLATKWAKISSIYSKIKKLHPMFRDFSAKPYPMFRDFFFWRKSHQFERHTPVYLIRRVPPPPPGCISMHFLEGSMTHLENIVGGLKLSKLIVTWNYKSWWQTMKSLNSTQYCKAWFKNLPLLKAWNYKSWWQTMKSLNSKQYCKSLI